MLKVSALSASNMPHQVLNNCVGSEKMILDNSEDPIKLQQTCESDDDLYVSESDDVLLDAINGGPSSTL